MIKKVCQYFVIACALSVCQVAYSAEQTEMAIKTVKIYEPKIDRRKIHGAVIDTEAFELGAYAGSLSVEDFNTNSIVGLSGTYHYSQRLLFQLSYGQSDVDNATFEELSNSSFLNKSDRAFQYYSLQAGFNLFPCRSFFASTAKFNSGFYLMLGLGNAQFADNDSVVFSFGSSYRTVITDWLIWHVDFRDHIMKRDFLNDSKQTQNLEFSTGLNFLF